MRERGDKKETVPPSPEWLVGWQKELLETGAIYIPVVLETGLEDILDPDLCIFCDSSTVKAFTHYSVVSSDQKLVIGTENMPAYRCEKCSSEPTLKGEPELTKPVEYFSVEGLIEFFTKARAVLLQHGDTETANAFTKQIELEPERPPCKKHCRPARSLPFGLSSQDRRLVRLNLRWSSLLRTSTLPFFKD